MKELMAKYSGGPPVSQSTFVTELAKSMNVNLGRQGEERRLFNLFRAAYPKVTVSTVGGEPVFHIP